MLVRAALLTVLLAIGISERGGGVPPSLERVIVPTDTAAAVAPRYREAEPMIKVVEREFPLKPAPTAPDHLGIRPLINLLLGSVAAFTVYAFLMLRKKPDERAEEPLPEPVEESGHKSHAPILDDVETASVHEAPPEGTPQAGETAESLRTRYEVHAHEIERLLKRL